MCIRDRPYVEKIDSSQSLEQCMKEENTGQVGVQIVSSGPDSLYPYTKESYLGMITRARRYLYIQTPYFIPDDTLLTALRCASRAGVDVRLMIPGVPDKAYAYHVTMWHAGELLRWGIPVYRLSLIHICFPPGRRPPAALPPWWSRPRTVPKRVHWWAAGQRWCRCTG